MDRERWQQIQALFHEAAILPRTEQGEFVGRMSDGDADLAGVVMSLLEEDGQEGSSLLDQDLAKLAVGMLDGADRLNGLPAQIGRYRLGKVIGEGGMGIVYRAERDDLQSVVAIKFLRDAWMSPARRERFASEQRALAQLIHPSIARLYDADALPDGTPWFAMEYVEGVALTDYCRTNRLSIDERLRLFNSVCEAVHYAHQRLIIHRDLKPSNVLVRQDGTVRLLDFGISRQLDSVDVPVDQTQTALRLFTPAYAAPEQILGEPVGVFTDVYALGVILYELLAGRLPFDLSSRTPGQAERLILEQEAAKPSVVFRRLPSTVSAGLIGKSLWADLDVLCLTAMHKDPVRRYRSVEAFQRDVAHFLKGEPLDARPEGWRYVGGKFVKRNWRALATALVVIMLIVGLETVSRIRLTSARNSALAATVRTQRVQKFMLNLFNGGNKEAGPAEDLRVLTLMDRGVKEAQTLNNEPEVQAELYKTLGTIYQQLGNLPTAGSLLGSALDGRIALFGRNHVQVVDSLVDLSLLRIDETKLDEAERLAREGLDTAGRLQPPDGDALAKATAA
ncbi:MAG: serine/threonine protein kinase, partial [Bryobacteraceae bacterium]|nr:serine/threonine protein kinase [Bryobacteraceae bacterium]